ncbi:MAG TPA: diguanylate cyclase [Blastococcus sp.]|jgi:diguanylate cyclase (GGDEF)-like protein/PAS domain S-box-containing protein|nr:diguanylate cyclase [Blastococcus sp.]
MTWLRSLPRSVRWTVALGLLGLAFAVPFSAPDGTGMQWDELVLGGVAASAAWAVCRQVRTMDRQGSWPWRILGCAAVLFMVAQWLEAAFPGPEFDGSGGIDKIFLFVGATMPVVSCFLLARRVTRTRWTALVVDGAVITAAVLVVTEVLRTPLVNPVDAPSDLRSLVLTYGAYAALMLGAAGAMCTVSTAELRRSATVMIFAVGAQASAAWFEAMAIVAPSPLWTAGSDVAVALGLQSVVVAAAFAPRSSANRRDRAAVPVVSRVGIVLVFASLLSLPLAIGLSLAAGRPLSTGAEIGCAVVFALMALRLVLRIREDGRVTEDLVRSEEDFRELIEASSDGLAIMDARFRLLFTSPAARHLLGLADADGDVSLLDLVAGEDRARVRAATESAPAGDGPPLHFRVRTGDRGDAGAHRELEVTSSERPGSGRRVLYLRDVTSRRRRERELERMAYTDHLTGLPNRAALFQEMAASSLDERCLLVLDLDGFKAVNDVAGHESGDQLLVEVARRLNTVVRDDDLVTRLGGDEFAILVTGTMGEAEEVAQRVVDALSLPHRVEDWAFAVGASVGVAPLGAAGGQPAFREADAALRAAKQAGKGCVRLADDSTASPFDAVDVATAIDEGDVTLRLDAACDPSGRIALVHAVPVWQHTVYGTLDGQDLWGAAERYGRSADLQRSLLRQACAAAAAFPDPTVSIAISLPAGHVTPDGLADEIAAALAYSGLAPTRLTLSITEETLLTSSAALVPELEAARRTGVRLCLDNYGMGHSLFALLARISLDAVRVDLTALAPRDDTDRALQVLAAIVRTTTGFGLTAIAGGISTAEIRDGAVAAGVQLLHGRHLPHGLSVADLRVLLRTPAVPVP